MFDLNAFVEKFHLARQTALETRPSGGLCGLELEWNLVDPQFRPLLPNPRASKSARDPGKSSP